MKVRLTKASDWKYEEFIEIETLEEIVHIFRKYNSFGGFVINIMSEDLIDIVLYDMHNTEG